MKIHWERAGCSRRAEVDGFSVTIRHDERGFWAWSVMLDRVVVTSELSPTDPSSDQTNLIWRTWGHRRSEESAEKAVNETLLAMRNLRDALG